MAVLLPHEIVVIYVVLAVVLNYNSLPTEGVLISLRSNDRLRRTIPYYGAPTNLVGLRGERRRWVLPIRQRIPCTSTAEREAQVVNIVVKNSLLLVVTSPV